MPRSLDGFARASTEFVLICHQGQTHQAGHYFAILIYRDLMWTADDGKVPQHLPNLTPKLASQITQVWAVTADIFKTPQQVLPMKTARYEQEHNVLYFANVTNMKGRSSNGTGPGTPAFTSLLKPILTHKSIMSCANTSPYVGAQSSVHQPVRQLWNTWRHSGTC